MRSFVFLSVMLIRVAPAVVTVSSPATISHRVTVQPIQVSHSSGGTATFMGDSAAETYIKEQIDRIWNQVGIDIEWLPLTSYTNSFAYDGSPGNYNNKERPGLSHLSTIVSDAGAPPKSSDPKVINLFFVDIPAGYKGNQLGDNTAAGLAFIDSNGTTIYVGNNLVTLTNWSGGPDVGKDSVAGVIAHEIGHCLGLGHNSITDNLLYSGNSGADPEYLSQAQLDTIILTDGPGYDGFDFAQSLSVEPPPIDPETNYGAWALLHGVTGGPEEDHDGDRLANGFEFFYGFDPTTPSSLPAPIDDTLGLVWSLDAEQDALADGFIWFAEASSDLVNWQAAGSLGTHTERVIDFSNFRRVKFRLNHGQPRTFIRFGVTPPAASLLLADPASLLAMTAGSEEPTPHQCTSDCCNVVTVELAE